MKISVASGKGGTGKTTIATNLAVVIASHGHGVTYVDGDVEEPNGHIFLNPEISERIPISIPNPAVDIDKCTFCGECSAVCQYHAIAVFGKSVQVFPELCHGCGGCTLACPEQAIEEVAREIGQINQGYGAGTKFYEGRLKVGEVLVPPITRALKELTADSEVTIIDAPPGTSCPVIEAINDTDYVLLVTEPTPFGLNDLKLAVEMTRAVGIPFSVILNRSNIGDTGIEDYCRLENIDIVMKIPFDQKIAKAYAEGKMMIDLYPWYKDNLYKLFYKAARRLRASV